MKREIIRINIIIFVLAQIIFLTCERTPEDDTKLSVSCKIITPSNGNKFLVGKNISITAETNLSTEQIKEVQYYVNGIGINAVTTSPFNFNWNTNGYNSGSYAILAKAKTYNGITASDSINIYLLSDTISSYLPTTEFEVFRTDVDTTDTVQFFDLSKNNPISWFWDFGDGETSLLQNPYHVFTKAGSYTITLITYNEYGSDTLTKRKIIDVTRIVMPCFGCEKSTIEDIDGNLYNTVRIGEQWWMSQNLAVTKLNNGTSIPLITDKSAWINSTSPAYCWYNNDKETYSYPYGALYNWYTVNTNKLCPSGWHVPSQNEIETLIEYLGGIDTAGNKLKEAGTLHWKGPNYSTNESGFTALPSGSRGTNGSFYFIGEYIFFWTSDTKDSKYANSRAIYYKEDYMLLTNILHTLGPKESGISVRCLKD